MIKLNLGSGGDYIDGYINIDAYAEKADERFDIMALPYDDNSVDEVKAFHLIEHLDFHEGNLALAEWNRILKPGGRIHLETPDLLESCKEFIKADEQGRTHLMGHFFSQAWIPGMTHKLLFTETQLRTELEWAKFVKIRRLPPSSKYLDHYPAHIFLNMEAYKA